MPHSSIHAIPKANHLLGGELAAGDAVQRIYTLDGYDAHPSDILAQHSRPEHRLGELYAYMLLRDTVLAALWRKRARATTGLPRFIFPADESDRAREVAIFCRDALGLIPNFHTNLTHQLRGITEGIAFDELIWERLTRGPLAGALVPVDAIDRPMHRFLFKRGQLHVLRAGFQSIPVPPARMLCMRHGSKDTPWGSALLDEVFWYWKIKQHALKYWAVFVEKWAQPLVKVMYPSAIKPGEQKVDPKIIDQALEIAAGIETEMAVKLPDNIKLELLEATRSGSVGYEQFVALQDRGMAMILLGEVDTSGLAKGPGSFAKSAVSNDVRKEVRQDDAHLLQTQVRENLIRPLVAVNYGPDEPVPEFFIDVHDADDRAQLQEGAERVLAAGLPVGEDYYYRVHRTPRPRPGERTILQATGRPFTGVQLPPEPEERQAA